MESTPKKSSSRLLYLDWVRGIAAIIMLQGHVFHSFLKPDLREGSAYVLSQFVGGMPPAVFLFLTGVTLAFLMDSTERKGLGSFARWTTALRRSGYLFGIAFLFRLQLWLFGLPDATWTDLFRVDILNCMGFAMLLMSGMSVFRTAERIRFCGILGLAIAAASPLMSQMSWSGIPPIVRDYLAPDYNHFGFFPWAAFMVFGMCFGSVLRVVKREHVDRVMQWSAVVGVVVVAAAYYFSSMPYTLYSKVDFWLNSPAQILIKQGVILLALPLAFLWTEYAAREGWSWVRQFGTTSLLVYWVHIELVYGRWMWFCKNSLDVAQTVVAAVLVILLMLFLSAGKTYRKRWLEALGNFRWLPAPPPRRVPGD